jgi:hypothetical protein
MPGLGRGYVVLVFGYAVRMMSISISDVFTKNRPDADNGQELLVGERVASITAYLRVEG